MSGTWSEHPREADVDAVSGASRHLSPIVRSRVVPLLRMVPEFVANAQAAGLDAISSLHLATAIAGATLLYVTAKPLIDGSGGARVVEPEATRTAPATADFEFRSACSVPEKGDDSVDARTSARGYRLVPLRHSCEVPPLAPRGAVQAEREHTIPGSLRRRVATEIIRGWLRAYRRGGFDALVPRARSDQGSARTIAQPVVDLLCHLKENDHTLT